MAWGVWHGLGNIFRVSDLFQNFPTRLFIIIFHYADLSQPPPPLRPPSRPKMLSIIYKYFYSLLRTWTVSRMMFTQFARYRVLINCRILTQFPTILRYQCSSSSFQTSATRDLTAAFSCESPDDGHATRILESCVSLRGWLARFDWPQYSRPHSTCDFASTSQCLVNFWFAFLIDWFNRITHKRIPIESFMALCQGHDRHKTEGRVL